MSESKFSWADLTSKQKPKKRPSKAYCTSYICERKYGHTKIGIIKNVPKTTIDCPDCGSALFWNDGVSKFFAEKEDV